MRFSTILSAALLVGAVAAAPMPTNHESEMMPSDKSSMPSSSGGCNGGDCGSSHDEMPKEEMPKEEMPKEEMPSHDEMPKEEMPKEEMPSHEMPAESSSSSEEHKMEETTSAEMAHETSTVAETSTVQEHATTTQMEHETATQTAEATSSATYGSGSSNWGGAGYNDCVQQCVASYGAPPATWTPTPSQEKSNDGSYHGSTGTGVTHTVIVAPTQGVLRYVPFAVNASVGDTVMFMWNAKNHTVTKSSALEICNKTSDNLFTSGPQNAPFTFTQVVNDTAPTFFFCNTPGHGQKGMFGMINPPSAYQVSTSVSQKMSAAVSNSSDLAAMQAYTDSMTKNNEKAATWGQNINLAELPDWTHNLVLENVMYTRSFLGANPETLKDNGFIDMGSDAPKVIPTDMAPVNNAVDGNAASQTAAGNAATEAAPAPSSPAGAAAGKDNGAASTAASTALLGVAAFAAAVLAF